MNKTVNSSDDLGNIELFDETNDDIKTEIVLFECNDTEVDQSYFWNFSFTRELGLERDVIR